MIASIAIVTFNSARYIERCLNFALASDCEPEIVVVDNASTDETRVILQKFSGRIRTVYNQLNNGFAGGQNQAIELACGNWVLTLNPDVALTPNFISSLIDRAESDPEIGSVCGKLLQMNPEFQPMEPARIDSTGIFFTPNARHLDRGSRELDHNQYGREEFVFGATGAAALFRREMIQDLGPEFFDEAFFAYREDADLAWRAQWLGWKCLYVPQAVAYHVRSVVPENRKSVSALINRHSVKNRFLMRIKNATWPLYRKFGIAMTMRDLAVVAGCLLREWASLPALAEVIRRWPEMLRKRKRTLGRKRATDDYIVSWFSYTPVSKPRSGDRSTR